MAQSRALLVLDLLNDIVHHDGQYAPHGYAEQVSNRGVLKQAATAIERARTAGIPVIYVVVGFSPDFSECPPGSPVFAEAREAGKLVMGTWATRIHDAVRPQDGDPIVLKRRISPFFGTELDLILRTRKVDTLLLTGVSTDLVILATARDGHDRDYQVEVLADATAAADLESHECALRLIARTATVSTVDEALPV
jgi:nicotinamidase-related amidase